ncbi:hypothetical protein SDC9_136920 [bioreactor metagenome]|uniref:Uncharacterized protein n=1 Tax=bioreactor metagenome TaxID=1076179 RepID=A0A645DKK8_9ZZZZ
MARQLVGIADIELEYVVIPLRRQAAVPGQVVGRKFREPLGNRQHILIRRLQAEGQRIVVQQFGLVEHAVADQRAVGRGRVIAVRGQPLRIIRAVPGEQFPEMAQPRFQRTPVVEENQLVLVGVHCVRRLRGYCCFCAGGRVMAPPGSDVAAGLTAMAADACRSRRRRSSRSISAA